MAKKTELVGRLAAAVELARERLLAPGTDQGNGVGFDQQDGSAVDRVNEFNLVGANGGVARHALQSAE